MDMRESFSRLKKKLKQNSMPSSSRRKRISRLPELLGSPSSSLTHSPIIQTHYTAGALTMLENFRLTGLAEIFKKPEGAHQVWNLLSMEPNLYTKFDHLNPWFEHPLRFAIKRLFGPGD